MQRAIVEFYQDEQLHWIAELECGHCQHIRHKPPWVNRFWVLTEQGRENMLGKTLSCNLCREQQEQDPQI
ncbi:DUF3565 domain-containing protein [Neptunicella marina]|uniref:DUF3565 domain-containing protein n=1 Tax=Neptunicella marina TaxID=2125989 RepID=A0A8J6LXX9_9ALTE|nr:DUF3565 domain-containing protein [Neptunicella marina]MBC3765095.1 DUF3565 domain-containing protein [Neptunicella marina]